MPEIEFEPVELEADVTEGDHIRGPQDAPVTLVEYADYQCPTCIQGFRAVEKLMETHGDRLRLVFRHFPLVSYHDMALPGAMAAEAAGHQGKFWQMHRRIFAAEGDFDDDDLTRFGQELELDMARYEEDRHSAEIEQHIRDQRLEGARSGVNGTPTFFLQGYRIDVARTHEHLAAYVDYVLEHADR
ncbi:MAG: thioredoxin domain-containing protein [Armatimonadota bacterium]|nr:thioredoxin domain-containing protein [Armatimonadota bacterium]